MINISASKLAILNRIAFRKPKEVEILPFVRQLQAQRLLSLGYFDEAEFLFDASLIESYSIEEYIEQVKTHKNLVVLQELFIILHEMCHLLCSCSENHVKGLSEWRVDMTSSRLQNQIKSLW